MIEDSFSKCHPLINLMYFVFVFGVTMFVQHPIILFISFFTAVIYGIKLCGLKDMVRINCMVTLPVLIMSMLLNPLFNHYGMTPLIYIQKSGNWITLEAIVYGAVLGAILFTIILWFNCYNKVMTTDKFVYLFGRIMPAFSLVLAITLRSVPRFLEQLKVIRNGQKCLGRDVSNAKGINKIKYGLNILSILITWSLENSIETADSMKSRGYGLKGRTAFSIYRFTKRDQKISGIICALGALIMYGIHKGAVCAQYNPQITLTGIEIQGRIVDNGCPTWLSVLIFIAFTIICLIPIVLDKLEK